MNLYEYEAKRLFNEWGIATAPSVRITRAEELSKVQLGFPLVLKCQVMSGGRGKAGGIKLVKDLKEGKEVAQKLLALTINGSKTESLLVEPKVNFTQEMYLSVTMDRARGCPIFIAAADGGIEIETNPNVITMPIPYPFEPYVARKLAHQMGLKGALLAKVADVAAKLYRLFDKMDLDLAEINPLFITEGEEVLAGDGKVTVNDDALGRQPKFKGDVDKHLSDLPARERKSKQLGLNLVELEGNIGIICNGAGLTMATMDMVKNFGGQPGNFLDAGGGSDQEKTLQAIEIVDDNPSVKVILLNILGGITACDEVASALVKFMQKHPNRKMVVRLRGNNQDKAEKMLSDSGLKLYPDLEQAVKEAVNQAKAAV